MTLDRSKFLTQLRAIERHAHAENGASEICAEKFMSWWQERFGENALQQVPECVRPYSVLGVDGSQCYPDRHMASDRFLVINIGGVLLAYGSPSAANFFSEPEIIPLDEATRSGQVLASCSGAVDLLREARVFEQTLDWSRAHRPTVVLFDGTLGVAHLNVWRDDIRHYFADRYRAALSKLDACRQPYAGYTSAPTSRELARLFETERNDGGYSGTDREILEHILQPGHYCIMPSGAVYLHVHEEIARVEMPSWIMGDSELYMRVITILYSQALKGAGYPVALGEAHHQAVLRGEDSAYIQTILREHGRASGAVRISRKQHAKGILGV